MRTEDEDEDDLDEENAMKGRFLSFHLASEDYGLPIDVVTEIVGMQKIAALPGMPDFIRGVMNLRGRVIPVMDVRSRFHLPLRAYDERTCVIVVQIGNLSMGLVVDAVNEVTSIPEDAIAPPPRVAINERSRYIQGIGKVGDAVKIILDVDKILLDHEQTQLQKVAA